MAWNAFCRVILFIIFLYRYGQKKIATSDGTQKTEKCKFIMNWIQFYNKSPFVGAPEEKLIKKLEFV